MRPISHLIYVATHENNRGASLFVGVDGGKAERIQGTVLFFSDLAEFKSKTQPPYSEDVIYFLAANNALVRWDGEEWIQLNVTADTFTADLTEINKTVGENADGNMVIRGECVSACAYLKSQGIQVDLVYIDPPFASGADYAKKVYIRRNPKVAEAIAQAEQELDVEDLKAFEEKMYGDVWDKEKYLALEEEYESLYELNAAKIANLGE